MISEYILFGLVLPVVILWGIRKENRLEEAQLLDKKDTSVLRGISAFFVIAAHYTGWVEKIAGGTNAIFKGLIGQLGGIGVLIFFFVSGYGLYESYGNREVDYRYLLKRLRGVYLPYVLMKLVLLLIEYLCHYDEIHIWKRLLGILLVEDWFIHVIVIQYLVFYVAKKISGRYVVLISILADIGLTVIYVLQEKPIGWFNALWLFTFGLAASQLQPKLVNMIRKRKWLMMAGTFLLFVILGGLFAINKGAAYANVLKPLSGVFLCLFLCIVMRMVRIGNGVTHWAGKRSMHIYIVHIFMWNILAVISDPICRLWLAMAATVAGTELIYRGTTFICNRIIKDEVLKSEKR